MLLCLNDKGLQNVEAVLRRENGEIAVANCSYRYCPQSCGQGNRGLETTPTENCSLEAAPTGTYTNSNKTVTIFFSHFFQGELS